MTGKGNATKEEMISFARLNGFDPVDDNAADALAILLAGAEGAEISAKSRVLFCHRGGRRGEPRLFASVRNF
ncbi:MAG: hypothetical protein LBF54_00915, partial [Holosporaceae bacterium]|nr:hypothetical protein [Holosporaceae bacterium]